MRLMLDGAIEGYSAYEQAVAAQSAEPLSERVAGQDMLYSSGTTGLPKGVARAFRPEPLETTSGPVVGVLQLLFGVIEDRSPTAAGAALPRRAVAASASA